MLIRSLSRAVAAVLWADEKVDPSEMIAAEELFQKFGISWSDAQPALEEELENLLDIGEEEEDESDEELDFGVIDLGTETDSYEVLKGLCRLACSDKVLDWCEIDIIHRLGESMNLKKELVSAALVSCAVAEGVSMNLEEK